MQPRDFARHVDHTLLKAQATDAQVAGLAAEAVELGCAAVCVNLSRLPALVPVLEGSPVVACCVNDFPLGAGGTAAKVAEAQEAVRAGAGEIDTVIDLGLVKAGRWEAVTAQLAALREACGEAHLKVILEMCLLTEAEKERAVEAAARAGAEWVKTSTGFSTGGATTADVALMSRVAAGRMKVKAAGGIATAADALALLEAGAERLGMSRTRSVMAELAAAGGGGA